MEFLDSLYNKEEDWNKPLLGETNHFKSFVDSQKKKCQTDTTRRNTEYKSSTVLITDLDIDTQPIKQAGGLPTLHK